MTRRHRIKTAKTMKRKSRESGKNQIKINRAPLIKYFEKEITLKFLEMLNTIKLYHWKTYSYATHKATDELYDRLSENMDKFIEVLLGKAQNRIDLFDVKSIRQRDMKTPYDFKRVINEYKAYLDDLRLNPVMNLIPSTDLFNIRDEILGDLNQFLYLYTFK